MSEIVIYGVSGDRLAPGQLEATKKSYAVVVSSRHRKLLDGVEGKLIKIAPVAEMVEEVAEALLHGDVAVLASGDPLLFGIGRTLIDRFGAERVRVVPALSAVQLACARFRVPWDDLVLLSLHGREAGELAGRILPHAKVMLFTDHRNSPDRIAATLLAALQQYGDEKRGERIRVRVAENLGLDGEKLTSGTLAEIARQRFGPLNMMLLEQELPEARGPVLGLQEQEIQHRRGLITKDEVRAVVLHRLRLPRRGVLWDVGGGSGSISLEAARLCPELQVYIFEKKEEGQADIRANIARYNLYNIHLVCGEAPEALAGLPDPDRVVIGGSGGRLEEIINSCACRLQAGGRMVATAVLQTTAELAPRCMMECGLEVDRRTISVTRQGRQGEPAQVLNPILIITGHTENDR